MNEKLDKLYSVLGYRSPSTAKRTMLEAAATSPPAAQEELPPLSPAEVEDLIALYRAQPDVVLGRFQDIWDDELSHHELEKALTDARGALNAPEAATTALEQFALFKKEGTRLPPNFEFPGMDRERIPIDPASTKFETYADALGWVLLGGPYVLKSHLAAKAPFRWHSDPKYASRFDYALTDPAPGAPLEVALFADFGTGLYHSRYIAKQLRTRSAAGQLPCAVHLGDVYYAGRESEFQTEFRAELDGLLDKTSLFTLAGNHEMYAGGFPFFQYIDDRKKFASQRQEGSYFRLRTKGFNVVATDSEYFSRFRLSNADLLGWTEAVLDEGRREGKINILLTSDEPYSYGKTGLTALLNEDLRRIVLERRLVDVWFWGNVHYCALYDRTDALPFIGCCIGHGGYPYERQVYGKPSPAPVRFLETKARFPEWTGVRQDRGNNGWCMMRLHAEGHVELEFIDWMGATRCTAAVGNSAGAAAITSLKVLT